MGKYKNPEKSELESAADPSFIEEVFLRNNFFYFRNQKIFS
jgi:hypothetical protein